MRQLIIFTAIIFILAIAGVACTNSNTSQTDDQSSGQTTNSQPQNENPDVNEIPDSSEDAASTPDNLVPPDNSMPPGTGTSATLPPEWPADIPIMEGLTIFTANTQRPTGAIIIGVGADGNLNIDAVQEFYSNLEGWTPLQETTWQTSGDERIIKLNRGPNETLGVNLKMEGGKVGVMFIYSRTGV